MRVDSHFDVEVYSTLKPRRFSARIDLPIMVSIFSGLIPFHVLKHFFLGCHRVSDPITATVNNHVRFVTVHFEAVLQMFDALRQLSFRDPRVLQRRDESFVLGVEQNLIDPSAMPNNFLSRSITVPPLRLGPES